MKRLALLVTLFILASCAYASDRGELLFPGSQFSREGMTCILDDLLGKMDVTESGLKDMLARSGVDYDVEVQDPFIRETLPFVEYLSSKSGREISVYLCNQFAADGWEETRAILAIEQTICGGDWLRVYSRGTQQVLVHICGPYEVDDRGEGAENILIRTITYRFRDVSPQEVLGTGYKISR